MVLHRPVELAALIGEVKFYFFCGVRRYVAQGNAGFAREAPERSPNAT
jgi:hypothetical protein